MNRKIIIIDGNSLLHRAYHGMRPLTNKEGEYTHGVYGFLRMLENLIKVEKPDGLGVAFDIGRTFRHEAYTEYKAGRKETAEELKSQFPLLKDALVALGIPVLTAEGFEADDILGTVGKRGGENGDQVILVTGDKDAFQLISPSTTLYLTRKGLSELEKLDEKALFETYGYTPEQAPDIKGLMGDSSDNIKGVFGIGAKNALNLIQRYGSLDGIYEHIDELKGKVRENLKAGKSDAYFSRELGTIRCDVPIDYNHLEFGMEKHGDPSATATLWQRLEFKNVFKDYIAGNQGVSTTGSMDSDVADTTGFLEPFVMEDCSEFLKELKALEGDRIWLLPEIEGSDLRGVQVCDDSAALEWRPALVSPQETRQVLEVLWSLRVPLSVYDSKSLYHILLDNGFVIDEMDVDDLSLLAYVLYPERKFTLENFLLDVFGKVGEGKYFVQFLALSESLLRSKGDEAMVTSVYLTMEKPLSPILAEMEHHGIGLNRHHLQQMALDIQGKIGELRSRIWALAGSQFNINSTQQLGVVLFETLKLKSGKKTKTGYSTNQEVLEKLTGEHEIVPLILDYRRLNKLNSTYVEGLLSTPGADGVVHTTYNQTVAVTGRLSSENPNLQNIPIRTHEGRLIRKAFVPVIPGNLFLCADYSQIELRILAHMAEDEGLIEAFRAGVDIHRKTASEVFDVPLEEVDGNMRRAAKAVNFGIIYGISDYGLARDLGIGVLEARAYIEKYFARYVKIRSWIDRTLMNAKETLKVYTLTGRYRLLPELRSSQFMVRAGAERMAMNAPIQGTAADLIKLAMIKVVLRMKNEGMESKLILQVHDELIFEVVKEELDALKTLVQEEMTAAMELSVPLVVDLKVGPDWYSVEEV